MKYFIGQVPAADLTKFGSDGLFKHNDEYYYNVIEFGTNPGGMEDFVVSDSIGRSVPLSIEHISVLIEALTHIQDSLDSIKTGKEAEEFISSNEILTFEW